MIVIRELPTRIEMEYSIFIDNIMTMTDSEVLERYQQPFPVSFKVIGVGTGATDIIEKVKSFGYDCVGCILAESPGDCIPMDDDKMVIIVARDNEEVANAIAKTYHEAGVLTIGLVYDPNIAYYDSILMDSRHEDFPEIIKTLLQPIVRQPTITMTDMEHLSDMISSLPESINVIWSVNFDDTLPYDLIRFSIIMSGNEL